VALAGAGRRAKRGYDCRAGKKPSVINASLTRNNFAVLTMVADGFALNKQIAYDLAFFGSDGSRAHVTAISVNWACVQRNGAGRPGYCNIGTGPEFGPLNSGNGMTKSATGCSPGIKRNMVLPLAIRSDGLRDRLPW